MTLRLILMAGALGALAACQPAIPESGAVAPGVGVGFDNSFEAQRKRDAELAAATSSLEAAPQVAATPLASANANATTGAPLSPAQQALNAPDPNVLPRSETRTQAQAQTQAQTQAQAQAQAPRVGIDPNSGRSVVNASPSNPPPLAVSNAGISDENDFDAVAGRQSIASDKARIAANRAQYEVVQPTALPNRSGAAQPNVVAYALQTSHPVGTQMHRRMSLISANRSARNCAAFASSDEAQIDFLARGGPSRDRKGLDPDGDGYACGWNPAPYRVASGS